MTELEFEEFQKTLQTGYKEERRLKWEFVAAIIFVPLFPLLILFAVFMWNCVKVLFQDRKVGVMKGECRFIDINAAFDKEKVAIQFAQEQAMQEMKIIGSKLVNHEITLTVYEAKIDEIKARRQATWDLAKERNTMSV